ncbi:hypothetical protein BJY01DRAFT_223566 [Aspergillus pseudoustus]|uniref:Uncharacterized protein n=1 Tax=Aspergillus pseudoustus TaxID=1810923 RepID=A0ABR4J627_9EURO
MDPCASDTISMTWKVSARRRVLYVLGLFCIIMQRPRDKRRTTRETINIHLQYKEDIWIRAQG